MRRPPPALLAPLLVAAFISACDQPEPPAQRPADPRSRPVRVHLDERELLSGKVVERLQGHDYVYLRLSVTRARVEGKGPPARGLRWIALEHGDAQLGEHVRVRSLARRTRVWDPLLERDFEHLDYAALHEGSVTAETAVSSSRGEKGLANSG